MNVKTPPSTPLSVELRALIDQRNILTAKSKSKVLNVLDEHIVSKSREMKERRDQTLKIKIIEEVFTSEESYLKHLEIAMKYFRDSAVEAKLALPIQLKVLFEHLESVYNVNGELLNQLRAHGEDIGIAFSKMAPFFKLYSVYAFDYRPGVAALQELCKTNPKLDSFIKRQESRPEVHCKLSSLLISPIQRVPRYRLLLRELLSHVPPHHPHHSSLTNALRQVEEATEHIDSLVSEQESMGRMVELQRSLTCGTQLIQPGRRLIKEGLVSKSCKTDKKSKIQYLILTSDMLVICKPSCGDKSLRCVQTMPLCSVCAAEIDDTRFTVTCSGGAAPLQFSSNEPYSSHSWVKAISAAVNQVCEGEQTLRRGGSVRLALLRKDLNRLTGSGSFTPRKRKQSQSEEAISHVSHSPWKRNRSKPNQCEKQQSNEEENTGAGPSCSEGKRLGYFSSFRKAISSISHTLQKYWIPAITGKENHFDRRLTHR